MNTRAPEGKAFCCAAEILMLVGLYTGEGPVLLPMSHTGIRSKRNLMEKGLVTKSGSLTSAGYALCRRLVDETELRTPSRTTDEQTGRGMLVNGSGRGLGPPRQGHAPKPAKPRWTPKVSSTEDDGDGCYGCHSVYDGMDEFH